MFERAFSKSFPVELRCDSGQRILAPHGEAILGWLGGASAGAAQPLFVPGQLLAPHPTSHVIYACNLPADEKPSADRDALDELTTEIEASNQSRFLAASLPGGQTTVITANGESVPLRFRWLCITADVSIGAVWRCFVRMGDAASDRWRAIMHDYIFDTGGGSVLNPPDAVVMPWAAPFSTELSISHPEGMLTSFPCSLGRVKVTNLSPNGWARRQVLSIVMQDDNRIVACFSDGGREMIATAAPSSRRAARTAA